jgi:hypothetical protein
LEVLWEGQDATSGNVRWALSRQWGDAGEAFPADSLFYVNDANITTDLKYLNVARFTEINGSGKVVGGVIKGSCTRNSTSASDTYNSKNAYFHDIRLVYPVDRPAGMRTSTAK